MMEDILTLLSSLDTDVAQVAGALFRGTPVDVYTINAMLGDNLGLLLLTWINFNSSMDR